MPESHGRFVSCLKIKRMLWFGKGMKLNRENQMKTSEIFAEALKFASEASDIPSDRILSESRDADAVLACLRAVDCDDEYLVKAEENLRQSRLNRGLTYSNIALRRSVMVVGAASSASECANSLVHELHHLVAHICEGANVDLSSEEACYLAGGLAQLIHNDAAPLLCDCCKKKKGKHYEERHHQDTEEE